MCPAGDYKQTWTSAALGVVFFPLTQHHLIVTDGPVLPWRSSTCFLFKRHIKTADLAEQHPLVVTPTLSNCFPLLFRLSQHMVQVSESSRSGLTQKKFALTSDTTRPCVLLCEPQPGLWMWALPSNDVLVTLLPLINVELHSFIRWIWA